MRDLWNNEGGRERERERERKRGGGGQTDRERGQDEVRCQKIVLDLYRGSNQSDI